MEFTKEEWALAKRVAAGEAEWAAKLVEVPVQGLLDLAVRIDQSGGDSGPTRRQAKALQEAALSIRESADFRIKQNGICGL